MSFTLIRSEWMPGIPCSICRGRFRHRMPHVFGLKLGFGCLWASRYSFDLQTPLARITLYFHPLKLSIYVRPGGRFRRRRREF